ncbi:MAG: hypothetical protein RLZZ211_428 [Bacteroidota bacterium]
MTILFIVMFTNKLLFRDNISSTYQVVDSIKKLPVEVYSFDISLNGFSSEIERFNKFEINFLETFFFKSLNKKFKIKPKNFLCATRGIEFYFDPFEGLHTLRIRINLITKAMNSELLTFLTDLKDQIIDIIGGKIFVSLIRIDEKEILFQRLMPFSSYDDNMTFQDLSASNAFPEFYTLDLFDYIHQPMRVIYFN